MQLLMKPILFVHDDFGKEATAQCGTKDSVTAVPPRCHNPERRAADRSVRWPVLVDIVGTHAPRRRHPS